MCLQWTSRGGCSSSSSGSRLHPYGPGRSIALATTLITIVCGVVMRFADPKDFDNLWVALWWAVQTVTTVGYGDEVPRTPAGRIIGAVLMLSGIGFLTVVTASITAAFIERVRRETGDPAELRVEAKLDDLSARLQKLESSLELDRR
jgi:voltage-gated potassium channel